MIKYVIFDMDGTLIDTEPIYKMTWVETGKRWGLDRMEERFSSIVGKSIESAAILMKGWFGEDFDGEKFFEERTALFAERTDEGIDTRPGCFELLEYLKSKNIPMALATSTQLQITKRNMDITGIGKYMNAIVTSSMVKRGKPSPDIFLEAARRIGADPSECIVCEDSYSGIMAAHSAEMLPIFIPDVLPPNEETDRLSYATVDSLYDVIELIEKENKKL